MVSRADRGIVANWWWTVDKLLLFSALFLMLAGMVLSLAASPPVAERIGVENFHFVKRHAMFLVPAIAILFGVSLLEAKQARRLALVVLGGSLLMMLAVLFIGFEAKGARRWISIGPFLLQPSEFLKPAFVVITAFLFAENQRRPEIPGNWLAVALFLVSVGLLMAQPDLGQTVLVASVWGALFFMAGMPWLWIAVLGAVGIAGLSGAYLAFPHVSGRIDRFITGTGDTFQVDRGREAIVRGGWLGEGPGEGSVKRVLPDSHTDFIFSVTAEEFGILVSMFLVAVFAFIVMRGLWHAMREDDSFIRLTVAGLVLMFGFQSIINMSVNLQLMPAKGMTLPFISYGGSSLLSVAFGMGLLLALTRKRAEAFRKARPVVTPMMLPQSA